MSNSLISATLSRPEHASRLPERGEWSAENGAARFAQRASLAASRAGMRVRGAIPRGPLRRDPARLSALHAVPIARVFLACHGFEPRLGDARINVPFIAGTQRPDRSVGEDDVRHRPGARPPPDPQDRTRLHWAA
jgi:hypothetical protein